MISHCNFIPESIWIRELESGIRHITLRRNFTEEVLNNNEVAETQYKFEEIDIYITDRDNIENYINDNFDVFFEQALINLKESKIKELSDICNKTILGGFISSAKGVSHLYDFELENQVNIMSLISDAKNGIYPNGIPYYYKSGECELYTLEEFTQLYLDCTTFKLTTVQKYKTLKEMVLNATTEMEVGGIVWDMELN